MGAARTVRAPPGPGTAPLLPSSVAQSSHRVGAQMEKQTPPLVGTGLGERV